MCRNAIGGDRLLGVLECGGNELVVRPAAFLAQADEAGVAQGLQMEGEQGLAAGQVTLQVADALLTAAEQIHDPQAARIGERLEEACVARETLFRRREGSGGGR